MKTLHLRAGAGCLSRYLGMLMNEAGSEKRARRIVAEETAD